LRECFLSASLGGSPDVCLSKSLGQGLGPSLARSPISDAPTAEEFYLLMCVPYNKNP
jgi:hypothetical protein